MANIFDTANYILEREGSMSAMKLQRLCYYAQAWSLVWDDEPLFDEDFAAWQTGPVCEALFNRIKNKTEITAADIIGNSSELTENQKDTIDTVLKHYAPHNADWLRQLTCQELPWNEARAEIDKGVETPVTKESMAIYYDGLGYEKLHLTSTKNCIKLLL